MSPSITCCCSGDRCTRSPYGQDALPKPIRLWQHRIGLKQPVLASITINHPTKCHCHVLRSMVVPKEALSGIKSLDGSCSKLESQSCCRYASIKNRAKTKSSGDSSPQLSCGSFFFSSNGTTPSRSPPSSHQSVSASPPLSAPHVRRPPRIQVSSLLADPHTRTYHLEVVQQPIITAAFETANLSRLALTPPVIVQLTVRDTSGNSVVPELELPFLVAHLSLFSSDGTPLDMGSSIGRDHTPPTLYGNIISSVEQLEDLQGNLGLFFLFPDVSIRWRGQYQLGINLLRLYRPDPAEGMTISPQGAALAETRTHVFSVVDRAEYSASPPTRLTQCFLRQGARMFNYISPP